MSTGRRSRGTTTAPAGGQDPKRMRPAGLVGAAESPAAASRAQAGDGAGGGVKKQGSSSAPAMVRDLMVDGRVLECNICFLPLKPPIFQCGVGHVLCSPCSKSDKIKDVGKCYVCGVALPGGYQRCHAMEDVINSICGPCPHAPYGCDATPVYHAREEHIAECPHAPCHCPGDGCSFVGSVTTLVEHLTAAHRWPCTAEPSEAESKSFDVNLRDGFNFLTAVRGGTQYLLLLNVASTPFGRAISVVRICSVATTASSSSTRKTTCNLELNYYRWIVIASGHSHISNEGSQFPVECRCPSNGLPDPNSSLQLFIPKYVASVDKVTVHITARIIISSS